MYPSFSIFNMAAGMFCGGLVILALWYSSAWHTSHLPVFSSQAYDHFGTVYDVTQTVDARGLYDHDKYMQYSFPYLPPNMVVGYLCSFCVYSAVVTHVILYHRYEIALGFRGLWTSLVGNNKNDCPVDEFTDVHARLMKSYREGISLSIPLPLTTLTDHSPRVVVSDHPRHGHGPRLRRPGRLANLHIARRAAVRHCPVRRLRRAPGHRHRHDGHPHLAQRPRRVLWWPHR